MTTSFARMEEGKATCVGRCCSSVAFPLRQGRRISNLFPRVAVISQSEGGDVGPAVIPPRGCRATLIHPGCFLPLAGVLGGRVERVGSATASFLLSLTKRDQLGGDLLRDGAQSLPGIGVFHVPNMEQANVPSVAPAYVTERG